ncbi:bromodomain-containing protein [Lysobacter gummosus]|uniref:hypothetical protein n=1 Tax=Lysobacter gummosus TaxID=262324 RepID=UPI00362678F6
MKRFPHEVSEKRLKALKTTHDARPGRGVVSPVRANMFANGLARSRLLSSGL